MKILKVKVREKSEIETWKKAFEKKKLPQKKLQF